MISVSRLRAAGKAFVIHLGLSALVAGGAASVVLGLWFPYPYRDLAGGQHLLWVLVGVDVVCGPLLTAILFNPQKSSRELRIDLTLVACIQLAALAYGLHSSAEARPVVLAFEVDRFVVVAAADLYRKPSELASHELSWVGPELVGTRTPRDQAEALASLDLSLRGIEPSGRPDWWQAYEASRSEVIGRMHPISALRSQKSSNDQAILDKAAQQTGQRPDQIFYLPLVSRKSLDEWIVLLDPQARIIGYAPLGGFEGAGPAPTGAPCVDNCK
jgi:hypothetical protein